MARIYHRGRAGRSQLREQGLSSAPETVGPRSASAIPTAPPRVILVDALRGSAIYGMVAFHLAWDLNVLHLTTVDPSRIIGWVLFGHAVATIFLAVSGMSLVLAAPRGRRTALLRIGWLAVAALLVTFVTFLLFGQDLVLFGILHCIALADLVGLALLRVPVNFLLSLAMLVLVAPSIGTMAALDGPAWSWLGLGLHPPSTVDFRPIFPWGGVVFLGMALARLVPPQGLPQPRGRLAATLAGTGRHALGIYLLHQPVLWAILLPLSWLVPPAPFDILGFDRSCRMDCVRTGAAAPLCEATCGCVAARLRSRPGFWPDAAFLGEASRGCLPGAARPDDQ